MKDTLTTSSCALAHDLGNPPFGHAGEVVLNTLSKDCNYEGNAQTFRILDHIEEKHFSHNGLNLTIRTLLGVVKYPFPMSKNPNKYLYDDDFELVNSWATKRNISLKTIDCEIMDIADEIAYAAHDLDDALRLKYFNIDDLIYEFEISEYHSSLPSFKDLMKKAKKYGRKSDDYKSSEEFSLLFRKELTSLIVDILIKDIDIIPGNGSTFVLGFTKLNGLAKGLKILTFNAIKRTPDIYQYELMGEKVLKGLYEVYMDDHFNKDLKLLPAEYRDLKRKERTILDYIGGMMDSFAINQYNLLFGKNNLRRLYK
jgi:dGTPase